MSLDALRRTLSRVVVVAALFPSSTWGDVDCDALSQQLSQLQAQLVVLDQSGWTALKCQQAPDLCQKHAQRVGALQAEIATLQPQVALCQAQEQADAPCRKTLGSLLAQLHQLETPSGPPAYKCEQVPDLCRRHSQVAAKALADFNRGHATDIDQLNDVCGTSFSLNVVPGAAPRQILELSDLNGVSTVSHPPSYVDVTEPSGLGAATACHHRSLATFSPGDLLDGSYQRIEWQPLLDQGKELSTVQGVLETVVGISGIAVQPQVSEGDVPFTHAFGYDYEFMVAPDQPYFSLLAPSNSGVDHFSTPGAVVGEYASGVSAAKTLGITVPGVLGVELDQGMIPPDYHLPAGARVALYGRWTVDCGHPDFHTEMHPPLLTAAAVPRGTDRTEIGRASCRERV